MKFCGPRIRMQERMRQRLAVVNTRDVVQQLVVPALMLRGNACLCKPRHRFRRLVAERSLVEDERMDGATTAPDCRLHGQRVQAAEALAESEKRLLISTESAEPSTKRVTRTPCPSWLDTGSECASRSAANSCFSSSRRMRASPSTRSMDRTDGNIRATHGSSSFLSTRYTPPSSRVSVTTDAVPSFEVRAKRLDVVPPPNQVPGFCETSPVCHDVVVRSAGRPRNDPPEKLPQYRQ
jgi:hypothetical protein